MTIDERSLDEAIQHAREVAEIQRNNDKLNKTLGKSSPYYNTDCIKCAEEHEQLAELLEELKDYQDKIEGLSKYAESQYNKAIDDFQEWLKTQIVGLDNTTNEILVVVDDRWELATDKFKECE